MKATTRSYLYAGLAVFFWSTIATAFKVALKHLSILQLLFIASATSMIINLAIATSEGYLKNVMRPGWKRMATSTLLALLVPLSYYLILLKAYSLLPAQVAQPLNMIWPIVLVFLSVPLLKHKIPLRSYLALTISFAGVYLISTQGSPFDPGNVNLPGVLLAGGSSVFWALYFIFNVRDKRPDSVKLFHNFLVSTIILFIVLLFTDGLAAITSRGILSGIYVGIFEMGITYFLWLRAMATAPTSDRIANLVFLAPFASLFFINIILDEKIYFTTPVGLLLIISGIIYMNFRRQ